MTEEVESNNTPEAFETEEETDVTNVVAQIIAFVAVTAGSVALTRFVMNRFEARKARNTSEIIEVTSNEA